jgi:hypothetical protein
MKRFSFVCFALLALALLAIPAVAQPNPLDSGNYYKPAHESGAAASFGKAAYGPGPFIPDPRFEPGVRWTEQWICESAGPAEVQGYRVQCGGASFLDFYIADCCIDLDHWQLKGKAWDANPNTAVTTSPGPRDTWGVPGRVYNYGGSQPYASKQIDAYIECTYLHGVNVFNAGSWIAFASDGACVVTPDVARSRIDRTP